MLEWRLSGNFGFMGIFDWVSCGPWSKGLVAAHQDRQSDGPKSSRLQSTKGIVARCDNERGYSPGFLHGQGSSRGRWKGHILHNHRTWNGLRIHRIAMH